MRALTCLSALLVVGLASSHLPLRSVRSSSSTGSALKRCVASVDSWAQPSSFFEDDGLRFRRVAEESLRTSGARATEYSAPDSLAFFAPDSPSRGYDDDEYDDLLPPKAPEPVREGELGGEGRYDDAGEGRTEGFYAALQEAPDRLRASDLNEVLQPDHMNRLRFTNFPLQAYGALFKWDLLVEDVLEVYRAPWRMVAEEHSLRVPDDDEVLRAVGMRPERAIMQTFMWSDDWGETQKLAFEHFEAKAQVFRTREFAPSEGVLPWLQLLHEYQVPCCLVAGTSLDSAAVQLVLEKSGLAEYFGAFVSAEDECETAEQSYLVGSIKLRRPPMRCVVFEDDPKGVAAAHEASSKAVALMGSVHGADLRHADMRISDFSDLSLMSLRELFKDQPPIE